MISLLYKGKQGENVIRSLRNTLDKILLEDVEPKFIYTESKLSVKFQIKDKTKDEHTHDLAYYVKCLECDKCHRNVSRNNFQILGNGHQKMKFKRKLSEALYMKDLRPSLKTQETSVVLNLFN